MTSRLMEDEKTGLPQICRYVAPDPCSGVRLMSHEPGQEAALCSTVTLSGGHSGRCTNWSLPVRRRVCMLRTGKRRATQEKGPALMTVSTESPAARRILCGAAGSRGAILEHGPPCIAGSSGDRTFGERVADDIASFGGSWPFIFIFLGMIVAWMVVNTSYPTSAAHRPFDPYPYIALNLVLSGLAGIQAPIIMMSQNRAAARDEILASHHYDETHKIDDS